MNDLLEPKNFKEDYDTNIQYIDMLDIVSNNIPPAYQPYQTQLNGFAKWVNEFLAKGHTDLGRSGAVCPYIQYSKDRKYFKIGVFELPNPEQDKIVTLVRSLKDAFIKMEPFGEKEKRFKAITLLFPNLQEDKVATIIDDVQLILKKEFVTEGLMIGQFHEKCEVGGLRNSKFRPLQSPVPLLAIRNMVETDWPFLEGDALLEEAYNKKFGGINFGIKE